MYMVEQGFTIHQNIVKEDDDKLLEVRLENTIHQGLKNHRSIRQSEWHHAKFTVVVVLSECSLLNVVSGYQDLVIPRNGDPTWKIMQTHAIHRIVRRW